MNNIKDRKSSKQFQGKKRGRDSDSGKTGGNIKYSTNKQRNNPKYSKYSKNKFSSKKTKYEPTDNGKLDPNEEFKKQLLGEDNNQEEEISNLRGNKQIQMKEEINLLEIKHSHIFSAVSEPLEDIIKKQRDKYINKKEKTIESKDRIKINSLLGKKIIETINFNNKQATHMINATPSSLGKFQTDLSNFLKLKQIKHILQKCEKKIKFDVNSDILSKVHNSLNKEKTKLIFDEEEDIFGEAEEINIQPSNSHKGMKLKLTDDKEDDIFKLKEVNLSTLLKSVQK